MTCAEVYVVPGYVSLRYKAAAPLEAEEARELISDDLAWNVVVNDGTSVLEAVRFEERYGISF
jgi:hypothetical protein